MLHPGSKTSSLLCGLFLAAAVPSRAGWGQAPPNWGDIKFGLVNDGKALYNDRMKAALADGIQLGYRYVYINNGVQVKADPAKNAYSWLFSEWNDYAATSKAMGLKSAFVIYMLQEDQGTPAATLAANAQDPVFMANYFTTLKLLAEKVKGEQAVFVLEPDTWGYAMQAGVDPTQAKAVVNNLGGAFSYLSDLPNTYTGMVRGMVRTVKRSAPDAYAGVLMSHWTPDSYDCPPPDIANSNYGMPWRSPEDIDCSADRNVAFAKKLLGDGADRGDFIGVEKNGHSAGYWYALDANKDAFARRYFWNDQQNANWIRWCKRLGQGVDLPVLGWQISIGSAGLANTCAPGPLSAASGLGAETGNCAFEDTFFPYFFKNVKAYVDAGFIGFLAGKGLSDDADFTHADKDPQMGDKGWFFRQLKEFDKARPYLGTATGLAEGKKSGNGYGENGLVRTSVGWSLPRSAQSVPPRVVDSQGREVGRILPQGTDWEIGLQGLESGVYWLNLQGRPAIALPRF
ncbi:MAG: hypothetical protein JWO30_427 [Fibrobacteres bacterium]|nr:hypothetical protein [Fibrobacterota bacterium]